MHQSRPFPDIHPEFAILDWPGFTEYRVENWRLARDGSGRVISGTCVWSWLDLGVVLLLGVVLRTWFEVREGQGQGCPIPIPVLCTLSCHVVAIVLGIVLISLLWTRFTQILHESLLVFPTLGIQLETHRGHPSLPTLFTTHRFIPLSALEDVILHEGPKGWDVRYYLATLKRPQRRLSGGTGDASANEPAAAGGIEVYVSFENIVPHFPILHVVYLGVQQTLYPPPTRVETGG